MMEPTRRQLELPTLTSLPAQAVTILRLPSIRVTSMTVSSIEVTLTTLRLPLSVLRREKVTTLPLPSAPGRDLSLLLPPVLGLLSKLRNLSKSLCLGMLRVSKSTLSRLIAKTSPGLTSKSLSCRRRRALPLCRQEPPSLPLALPCSEREATINVNLDRSIEEK